jgi:transposase InsO family protein
MYPSYDMIIQRERLLKEILDKKRKIGDVAEFLGVSRETVSRWLAKYRFEGLDGICPKKPGPKIGSPAVNRTPSELEDLVCELAENNSYKGPQYLADLLERENNYKLDQTTIYRILKRCGKRYGYGYKKLKRKRIAYTLNEPGEEIQMDVTFPFGRARAARVFDAIDDCSRFVFGEVYDGHSQKEAIMFVNKLILAMPFTIKAIRTDCGGEFGSEFSKHLAMLGIEHRKNPPYTPQHNGKIERYHRTFKENEAYSWSYDDTLDELNYKLKKWLFHYNFDKRHSGLHMNRLTPSQKVLHASFFKPMQPHLMNVTGTLQLNIFLHFLFLFRIYTYHRY